jgi:transposase IS200 family protein
MFDVYGRLRAAGHRINLPDAVTAKHARSVAIDPPKTLTPGERAVVSHELSQHVAWPTHSPRLAGGNRTSPPDVDRLPDELREVTPGKPGAMWDKPACYAAAIEDNHVHLLFGPVGEGLGKFVGRLKGRTASELRKLPANQERRRIWTAGYWKVFLFNDDSLAAVQRYIEDHNTRRGLPASPYDWITPPPI